MSQNLKWWGVEDGKERHVFRDMPEKFTQIFDAVRKGETPEVSGEGTVEIPDLRDLLIRYGEYRVKSEFTIDQSILKLHAIRSNLDRILNLYIEQISGLLLPMGLRYRGDPCQYLRDAMKMETEGTLQDEIRKIGEAGNRICDLRSSIGNYISAKASEIFPNLYGLVGDISIDLLYHAGGLRRMAFMPAGTIQILGAEKALFRHNTYGSKPPKHGVIFKFPGLSSLPSSGRGKVARIMANKVAIAARADYLGTSVDIAGMKEKIMKAIAAAKSQ